jgi:hypothetical protein
VITLSALIHWWHDLWPSAILGGVFLIYVLVLGWSSRRGYVRFQAVSATNSLLETGSPPPPLRKEEMVPMRASGWFSVEGQTQYYVDVEADFETVGTREHIVLGRVHPSRFLWLGQRPKHELGWWYIFFLPAMIRQMRLGHLHFGPHPHLAIQVIYAPDEDSQQSVYFTFGDSVALRRIWDDLLLDAPPEALA